MTTHGNLPSIMQSPVRMDNRWLTASSFGHSSSFITAISYQQLFTTDYERSSDIKQLSLPLQTRFLQLTFSSNNAHLTVVVVRKCS